jgi:hypothetical protein
LQYQPSGTVRNILAVHITSLATNTTTTTSHSGLDLQETFEPRAYFPNDFARRRRWC